MSLDSLRFLAPGFFLMLQYRYYLVPTSVLRSGGRRSPNWARTAHTQGVAGTVSPGHVICHPAKRYHPAKPGMSLTSRTTVPSRQVWDVYWQEGWDLDIYMKTMFSYRHRVQQLEAISSLVTDRQVSTFPTSDSLPRASYLTLSPRTNREPD